LTYANTPQTERETEVPELLAKYLDHIGRGQLLSRRQEVDLGRRAKSGDERARRDLIEKNPGGKGGRRARPV
jgi:DNA-directed RNA polymerase sigma subunit (sigma70/sigma32)